MNSTIRIVAAVLDTAKLTLYEVDGTTITLQQGDSRIRRIIDEATPQILEKGFADINMASEVGNPYLDFEEKSTKVRFFRVAKEKLKALFGFGTKEEEEGIDIEDVHSAAGPEIVITGSPIVLAANSLTSHLISEKSHEMIEQHISKTVIDDIMAHAMPASDPMFSEEGLDKQNTITDGQGHTPDSPSSNESTDTIVAISGGKVIPGMERIKTQFARAAKLGSVIGVEKFLERIGKVIHERRHSVEDLLKFLERADLPVAEDGTILIYKVLNRRTFDKYPDAKFADCHSGNVPQWVGARVCMAVKLVDPNRSQDCSNGLHVARRGYVSSFSGSCCVLAKLAPEDVIAVPEYSMNKMRVCGYNIIFELSDKQYSLVKSNRPLTEDAEGQIMLAKALKGDHLAMTHQVEITAGYGGGIQVTNLIPASKPTPALRPLAEIDLYGDQKPKEKLVPAKALEDKAEALDNPVDPRDVVKQVEDQSYRGRITRLYTALLAETDKQKRLDIWNEMLQIKKTAKKSWENFAIPDSLVKKMSKYAGQDSTAFGFGQNVTVAAPVVPAPAEPLSAENESYSQRINKLASITPMDAQTAEAIHNLKKQAKKGWAALKVSDQIVDRVRKLVSTK